MTPDPQSGLLRVASFNVQKGRGMDFLRRPGRTIDVIAGLKADIVALQEADHRLGPRPAALCHKAITARTGLVPATLAINDVSLGWHGNALLVKPGIRVESVARLNLPALEPRGAVVVDLRRAALSLRVVAAHLGLTRRHRERQLHSIAETLRGLPARPTVVMGDFNEWSTAQEFAALGAGFTVHRPGASFPALRPVAALDCIATCGQVHLRESGVAAGPLAARASDHLPVWADIRVPDQNASGLASRAM